ncbi:MAG TPA: MDR family MFS transporter [Stellaceae bacterium]|nr:MDR family MFS transporter [Stellaceae bacterium]
MEVEHDDRRVGAVTAAGRQEAAGAFSHREILVILSGILLGMMLAALDQSIVATALPAIAGELNGLEHLSWIVSGYLLTSTASTPIYGKLSDLFGRRILLETAIVVFVAASLLCGIAQDMPQLIIARALQGLGGGGLISMAQAVIADVISPRERGRYQGYLSGMWATASVGGPVLGGFFVDYLSWRWVFWINLPLGVAAFILCRRALARLASPRRHRRIDYLGAMLLTAAVADLLLVASWGGTTLAWTSPVLLGLVAAALPLVGGFIVQELRAPEPILPPRLFANPVIGLASLTSFIVAMAMFGAIVLLPVFLQLVLGVGAGHSGVLLIPLMGGTVVGAFASGQLMRRTGRYKLFPLIGLVMSTAAFALLATMGAATPAAAAMVYMGLLGIGIGMSMPVMLVAVQNAAAPGDLGVATAAVAFSRSLGGSFGAAILWSVLLAALERYLAASGGEFGTALLQGGPDAIQHLHASQRALLIPALVQSFHLVFGIAALIAAVSVATTLFLKEVPLRTTTNAVVAQRKPPGG